jgi:ferredoxin-NADP reductase
VEPLSELVVQSIQPEAEDVVSLHLVAPDGGDLPPWAPGAHVDVLLAPGLERQYSLCGDPADRTGWRLAVRREPGGRGGSAHVHDHLVAGDRLGVRGPRNNFALAPAGSYVFIAGGIGVTPILPMVRAATASGIPWEMVYGGRRQASMAFLEELSVYAERVLVWPEDRNGLIDLDRLLGVPRDDCKVYCCGPEPLIDAVIARCRQWPEGALHIERFRAPEAGPDVTGDGFEIYLDYSELTLTVPPGQTILQVVEAAGLDVLTSCREGTCGTCETRVLEGTPDHRDHVLSPEDRASGEMMMICCSRSRSPRLVLDL